MFRVFKKVSDGAKRDCFGPNEARISMCSLERMSADRQGASSHRGRMNMHKKGES